MKYQTIGIFPTPVLKFNLDREFTAEELQFFIDNENSIRPNVGNNSGIDSFILREEKLKSIKAFCEDALRAFYLRVYAPVEPQDSTLYITQSWLNYSKPGEYHHTHYHPNSIASGVFYINTNDSDSIIFQKPVMQREISISNDNTEFTTMDFQFTVKTCELILFPSTLWHTVPLVTGNETRISLAFNSFIKGKIGSTEKYTYLEL